MHLFPFQSFTRPMRGASKPTGIRPTKGKATFDKLLAFKKNIISYFLLLELNMIVIK